MERDAKLTPQGEAAVRVLAGVLQGLILRVGISDGAEASGGVCRSTGYMGLLVRAKPGEVRAQLDEWFERWKVGKEPHPSGCYQIWAHWWGIRHSHSKELMCTWLGVLRDVVMLLVVPSTPVSSFNSPPEFRVDLERVVEGIIREDLEGTGLSSPMAFFQKAAARLAPEFYRMVPRDISEEEEEKARMADREIKRTQKRKRLAEDTEGLLRQRKREKRRARDAIQRKERERRERERDKERKRELAALLNPRRVGTSEGRGVQGGAAEGGIVVTGLQGGAAEGRTVVTGVQSDASEGMSNARGEQEWGAEGNSAMTEVPSSAGMGRALAAPTPATHTSPHCGLCAVAGEGRVEAAGVRSGASENVRWLLGSIGVALGHGVGRTPGTPRHMVQGLSGTIQDGGGAGQGPGMGLLPCAGCCCVRQPAGRCSGAVAGHPTGGCSGAVAGRPTGGCSGAVAGHSTGVCSGVVAGPTAGGSCCAEAGHPSRSCSGAVAGHPRACGCSSATLTAARLSSAPLGSFISAVGPLAPSGVSCRHCVATGTPSAVPLETGAPCRAMAPVAPCCGQDALRLESMVEGCMQRFQSVDATLEELKRRVESVEGLMEANRQALTEIRAQMPDGLLPGADSAVQATVEQMEESRRSVAVTYNLLLNAQNLCSRGFGFAGTHFRL